MNVSDRFAGQARELLRHYFATAGVNTSGDSGYEIESIIDRIIDAAVARVGECDRPKRPSLTGRRFLRQGGVKDRTGLSAATIYRLIADEKFPAPVPLGPGSVGWVEDEVDGWINDRIIDRDRKLAT